MLTRSVSFAIRYKINPWVLGQGKVEGILRKHLEQYGCHVEFGTELRSFEQHADNVVAHVVKLSDEEERPETVTCHWLVGTDGARGTLFSHLDQHHELLF